MLEISKLSFSYGKSLVIDQLDWAPAPGTIHGLVGMNGAGKTTLFRLISGGLTSKRGSIIFKGKTIDFHDCGIMETHPIFYPMISGKEYLQVFTLRNKHFDIGEWNAAFNLPLNDVVDNYSTGMQKKLSLMGIIALNRPLLILDEPFNGLDFEAVRLTRRILQKLSESGKTIIVSSHISETLTHTCDTLSMMDKGKIAFQLTRPEFNKFEALSETLIHNAPLPDIS